MTITPPAQIYSFTDWSAAHPLEPPPGDRIDAQFIEHKRAIDDLTAFVGIATKSDGTLKNGSVTDPMLAGDLSATLIAAVETAVSPLKAQAQAAAAQAAIDRAAVLDLRDQAQAAASSAAVSAGTVTAQAGTALAVALGAVDDANELVTRLESIVSTASNAENDAALAAATAQEWAEVSVAWAEYMPGPIPPNILAIMGITGDHWSSKWWSNQANTTLADIDAKLAEANAAAAAAAESESNAAASEDAAEDAAADAQSTWQEFNAYYLGAFATPPTTDNEGNPLLVGAEYFDTAIGKMRIWNGTIWQDLTGVVATTAADVSFAPAAGIAATDVQAALEEVVADTDTKLAGKLASPPSDGTLYGQLNGAWSAAVTPAQLATTNSDVDALETRMGVVETKNTAQDGRLDAVEAKNTSQDAVLATKVAKAGDQMSGPLHVHSSVLPSTPHSTTVSAGVLTTVGSVGYNAYLNPAGSAWKAWNAGFGGAAWFDTPTGKFVWDISSASVAAGADITISSKMNLDKDGRLTLQAGNLVINKAAPAVELRRTTTGAGSAASIAGYASSGVLRWNMALGNADDDFVVTRCDDAGVGVENSIQVTRSNGAQTFRAISATFTGTVYFGSNASGGTFYAIADGTNNILALTPSALIYGTRSNNAITISGPGAVNIYSGGETSLSGGVTRQTSGRMIIQMPGVGAQPSVTFYPHSDGVALGVWGVKVGGTPTIGFGTMDGSGNPQAAYATITSSQFEQAGTIKCTEKFLSTGAFGLDVAGFSGVGSPYIVNIAHGNPGWGDCYLQLLHYVGTWAGWRIQTGPSAFYDFRTDSAFKAGGGAWADSSDARIKNELGEYLPGLDAITKLRPVRYTFKGNDTDAPPSNALDGAETEDKSTPTAPYANSSHKGVAEAGTEFIGLIAQEVEALLPEMVTKRKAYIDGVEVDDLRDLDTSPLIFALVNAVKELAARVETLEAVA